jgi:hypothetical protein
LLGEDGEVGDGVHGDHHQAKRTANAKGAKDAKVREGK